MRFTEGSESIADAEVEAAAAVLRRGGLVAFPTETVYGLGCDARDPEAVARVFSVKGRPAAHPLIVHLGEVGLLDRWARDVPGEARRLAERFWPGPLTLILPRAPGVPDAVTGGQDTVGLRVPDHPVALALLGAFGDGVAAPSANRFGRVSPTRAEHVRAELGDRVDYILDGGGCAVGLESTIVDLSGERPALLRPGGISREALQEVIGPVAGAEGSPTRSPGRLPSHYAPRARVVLAAAGEVGQILDRLRRQGSRVGVIATEDVEVPGEAALLAVPGDLEEMARVLYDRLRAADRLGLDAVVVVPPPEVGIGRAIADRLQRAAAPRPPGDRSERWPDDGP